jgi:hypothetical protein
VDVYVKMISKVDLSKFSDKAKVQVLLSQQEVDDLTSEFRRIHGHVLDHALNEIRREKEDAVKFPLLGFTAGGMLGLAVEGSALALSAEGAGVLALAGATVTGPVGLFLAFSIAGLAAAGAGCVAYVAKKGKKPKHFVVTAD